MKNKAGNVASRRVDAESRGHSLLTSKLYTPAARRVSETIIEVSKKHEECIPAPWKEFMNEAGSESGGTIKSKDAIKSDPCLECGSDEFEYDNYWKEYICKECGWVSKDKK